MGKINLTQLQKRLLSGFILGPLVVLVIIYGGWPFAVMVAAFAVIALYEWVRLSLKIKNKIPYLVLGIPYVLFCFFCMYYIRTIAPFAGALLFIALVWASDIGAYLVGKKIGGPKMTPTISPNKTWAGLGGALLFPSAVFFLCVIFFFHEMPTFQNLIICVFFGASIGFSAQIGDLLISFVKRKAGVKDTGNLIPGHGGLLDRVDSMMFAAIIFQAFSNTMYS